jgi:hypothetical protein
MTFSSYVSLSAQSFTKIKSFPSKKIVAVSLDRYGNFLVSDNTGNIIQYDSLGNILNQFSPSRLMQVSFLEAWRTVKIFVYYRELQKFLFLNRFMAITGEYDFLESENIIGFARLATLANDDNLWIYDDSDFSLKKYNPERKQLLLKSPLNLIFGSGNSRFNFIREYENMVFLNDYNAGIRVFDNLGNYKKLIPFKNINYIGFTGDNLYFLQENELHFFNLYSFEGKKVELPQTGMKIEFVLVAGNRIMIFAEKKVFIYLQQ